MNLVEILVCVLNDRKKRLRGALHGQIERFRETMIGKHLITGGPAEQSDFDRIIVQFQSNLYKNYTNEQSIETLCRQFINVLKEFGKNSSDAALALEASWKDNVAKEIPKMKSSFLCSEPGLLAGERPGLQHHHDDGQYGNGNRNPDCRSFVKAKGDASVSGSTSATNNPSSDVFLTEGSVTSDSLPPGTKRPIPNAGFSPANLSPNRLPIEESQETFQNGPITHNRSPLDRRSVSEPHHASNDGKDQARRSLSHEGGSQQSDVKSRNKKCGKSKQDSQLNDTRSNSKRTNSRRNSHVETLERDLRQAKQQMQSQASTIASLTQQTKSQSSAITSLTQQLSHQQIRQSNINAAANHYTGYDKTNKKGTARKRSNYRKGSSQQLNTSQSLQQSRSLVSSDSNKSRRWTGIDLLLVIVLAVIGCIVAITVLLLLCYIAYKESF